MKTMVYFSGKTTGKSIEELQKVFRGAGLNLDECDFLWISTEEVPKGGTDLIIYAGDGDEAYVVVKSMDDTEGMVLDLREESRSLALEALREFGVCTEVYIVYPNGEKYDIPRAVWETKDGRQEASEHGFFVPESDAEFEVGGRDSGDDTPPRLWMRIKVDLAASPDLKLFSDWKAAGGEWKVALKLEDGSDFEWSGDADDQGHAEGLAIANATEEKRQQILSVTSVSRI